jgi:nucleoside-diphosphate-sugar epimerase
MMINLLTVGMGFIGSAVVRQLLAQRFILE